MIDHDSNLSLTIDEHLKVDASSITTMLDVGVHFDGVLTITNGRTLLISGELTGEIESNGAVIVNETGFVRGSIRAMGLQIAGQVARRDENDLLEIHGAIVLAETANVTCDAASMGFKSAYGAQMDAAIRPFKPKDAPRVAVPEAKQTVASFPGAGFRHSPVVALDSFESEQERKEEAVS